MKIEQEQSRQRIDISRAEAEAELIRKDSKLREELEWDRCCDVTRCDDMIICCICSLLFLLRVCLCVQSGIGEGTRIPPKGKEGF